MHHAERGSLTAAHTKPATHQFTPPHGFCCAIGDPAKQKYPGEHGPEHSGVVSADALPNTAAGHVYVRPSPGQYTDALLLSCGAGHASSIVRVDSLALPAL